MWEPLPLIVYGYAVHPLAPSRRDTRFSARNRLSTVTEASTDEHSFSHVVTLEVGDEVYAFERYTPTGRDAVEGVWYRGYAVCTTRRPPVTWSLSSDGSTPRPPVKSEEPQQVFIGIFPASHIYVRDELADAEGRLHELARSLNGGGSTSSSQAGSYGRNSPGDLYAAWNKDKTSVAMGTLKEEDEDDDHVGRTTSIQLGPPPDRAYSFRAGLTVYSTSIRSSSPADSQGGLKPLPPRPSLKSGDDTANGAVQPIIDEIASALREWHNLMFQYLARRDYQLFHIVKDQIEALHLGRRQLLAQTLSAEETVNMRRDCVTKLVIGNLVQGLDVIVRHPTWGGLVTVDVEGGGDSRSWISAVRMYAMQTSLAYLDITQEDLKLGNLRRSVDYLSNGSLPTPAHWAFPILVQSHRKTRSHATVVPSDSPKSPTTKFYHVFLDLRAFVASLCAPGETAELFFSLWTKHTCQFLTEDFCAILNHNGVLSRDPSSRIRTIFADLSVSDVQDPIYLVCRIIRNGALKIGSDVSSGAPSNGRRGSEPITHSGSFSSITTISYWGDDVSPISPQGGPRNFASEEQFRRPFGCAVLELTELAKMLADQSDVSHLREHTLPIYVPTNETSFSMIHQNIINGNTKEFEKSSRAESLALSVTFFRGDLQTVLRENTTLLQEIPHTLRLGFPDAVFPGETRNELYLKLWCGDFSTSHPSSSGRLSVTNFARGPAGNNIQITVEVKDRDGRTIPDVICQGSGEPPLTQFHSMVFQRCNEPTFGELLKLRLPSDGIPQWHLFFTFRNRISRSKSSLDASDKPYGFAFQPLFPDANTFVKDGSHTLVIYRADRLGSLTAETYLTAPCRLVPGQKVDQIHIGGDMLRLAPPLRDTLTIRTSLCSTRFTHNPILLQLLNWEKHSQEALSQLMAEFTFIGESEIVKYLRDIFDSLFGILVSVGNQSGELDLLVFNALVTILLIVQDRRFSNFQPVLDVYIERHFSFGSAASHLIHSMNRLLSNPTSLENAKPLRSALKVWHYIFKFIARSRELQKVKELGMGGGATAEHLETKFKRELRSHLSEVTRMMSTSSPASIIGTQTIALQHFTTILPELAKMFNTVELVSIVTTFANAVTAVKGKIVIWKLIMYLQIVKGFLFDNPQSRPLLVEAVVIWIKPHFGHYDEYAHTHTSDSETVKDAARVSWLESIRLCVTIIAVMLDKLQQNLVSPTVISDRNALGQEQENVDSLLSLLPRLLDSYREIQNPRSRQAIERTNSPSTTTAPIPITFPESYPFSLVTSFPEDRSSGPGVNPKDDLFYPSLGETAIVFLVLVLSAQTKHIAGFFESSLEIEGRERFVNLLSQFFKVAISILDNEAFPKTWLNANVLSHKVLIKIMDPVASMLSNEFIPKEGSENRFDENLWKEAFHMLLKLLSSEHLVIEQFSPQKRRAIWRLAGDLRGEGASILLNLWQALGWSEQGSNGNHFGGYQLYLHPLVGRVVNLCLSHHDQLRSNAVNILFSMVVSQYQEEGHFDGIEHEVVTKLDHLFMSDSKGDDISRAFFIGQLRLLFETTDVDEQLRERVGAFLDSVDTFLDLLLSVRALPEGEEFADDRVIATLRLMNFIRRIGRDEIYIKYVHQLVNMHLQAQNYVEAALTLKLHADLHEWDLNAFVPPMEDLGLPQQSHFHRKETLCLLILDYLGKGKAWENAVDICRELSFQHSEVTFNYARLSEILRHQATLLEHIITEQRYYPDYYRVTFYGTSFPAAIRDRRFIYRGYDWEKYGAFCERMLNKHPGAQLYKAAGDPPGDILIGSDQYIQCTAVTPEPNRDLRIFTNPDVPLAVRTYYEHCGINLFSSTRQVRKMVKEREEIWVEKTYYTTEEAFPTVLRRSEVERSEIVEMSPLENALGEIEAKTRELMTLHAKYNALAKTSQVVSTNALAMALNSAVDTPLNSGIASYRQLFFSPDYVERYPERAESVTKLRIAIDEQVRMIDSCLRLHGLLCSPEFIPFHETLMKFFRKNFRDEIRRLAVDDGTDSLTSPTPRSPDPQHPVSPYENSISQSHSSSSTARGGYIIPPLQLGRPVVTPPLESPAGTPLQTPVRQTPLQRHLAHLAKHGINAVSSAPGDVPGSDSISTESPHNSFVNVGNNNQQHSIQSSSTSMAGSYMGSMGSLGSLRGRFSRFGSLNFGRRNNGKALGSNS